MKKLSGKDLKLKANDIRRDIIKMLVEAKSGHSAGPLDMADIFAALYFNVMNVHPEDPKWEGRDYPVLSCGHICPVLYAAMGEAGYFPKEELLTLRKFGTRLHGHPHNLALPGIETSSGPLAQGSSQAVGIALGLKMDKKPNYVYLVVSDGEQQEGQTWEAVMMAGKNHLDNLIAVMDRNRIQIDGNTEDIMPLDDVKAKYESFNWHVIEIDGNNMDAVLKAYETAKTVKGKPIMIIANTLAGKGVSFMEGDYKWHGMPPNKEQGEKALGELVAEREKI
ncbi:MAG: transketolase [Candidatus Doudnabacteria bacterium]|nr:transketolase [Candidatus Doudnabacteria bacterium]